ncbi:hypothetical protein MMC13_000498 [Lambiella insularis]|nr:hypothetical protein [Lambiella insularis]
MEDAATQTRAVKGHNKAGSQNLQGQAATAALYATNADKKSKAAKSPLDADGKLSSAGAATSLKYATPQDLPWFPSVGIADPESSAGAAASLANTNQKPFEYWKPEYSAPANKSAHLAWEYKAAPLWQPELSAAGSKAALIAANHGGEVNIWRPEATAEGNSAAGQAMRMKNLSPALDYGYTADGRRRALMAATGAMSGRKRAGSTPAIPRNTYPDSANSVANALNAATVANRPSTKGNKPRAAPTDLPGLSQADATRIHDAAITNLGREMYTSHPPVAPEVEEKNRQAGIRAAAVSMAKQMYAIQQKAIENAAADSEKSQSQYAANRVHGRKSSFASSTDESVQGYHPYANLEEAARKLAAERLAKIGDPNAANVAYRDYYGASQPVQSRLSIRGRMRRRASSDGQLPGVDELKSQQIRSQMSIFNDKLAQIDGKKRQKDRDSLMAAAQRNVAKRMSGMDEKVFSETGKVSPAMMAEWEAKARVKAEADSSARMVNHGKINIGGGKMMDQSEVDAIARARVQPTLDEISEKAAAQRARDEEIRQAAEERKRDAEEQAQLSKERDAKTKDEWKRFKEEEKREERTKKDQEKSRKAEEKRLRDEEKRKSKSGPVGAALVPAEKSKETKVEESIPVLDTIPSVAPIDTKEITSPVEEDVAPRETEELERTTTEYLTPTSTEEVVPTTPELAPEGEVEAAQETTEEIVPTTTEATTSSVVHEAYSETADETVPAAAEETIPVASQEVIPENVTPTTADAIVARVFGAPIVAPSEEVPIPLITSEEPLNTTSAEKVEQDSTAPAVEPSTAATQKESVAARFVPSTTATATGPKSSNASPKPDQGPKLSTWLKSKFSRSSKSPKPSDETSEPTTKPSTLSKTNPKVEAPAAKGLSPQGRALLGVPVGDAATTEKENPTPSAAQATRSRSTSISSLSSDVPTATNPHAADTKEDAESEPMRGRTRSNEIRKESTAESHEATTPEEFEEAKDHFDAEKLPLPTFAPTQRATESPVRDSRFVENL